MQTLAVYAAAYRRGTHIIKAKLKTVVTGDPPDRDHWGVHDFRATFRFKKQDLDRLIAALRLPPKIVSGKRYSCTAETALLLYLYCICIGSSHCTSRSPKGSSFPSLSHWSISLPVPMNSVATIRQGSSHPVLHVLGSRSFTALSGLNLKLFFFASGGFSAEFVSGSQTDGFVLLPDIELRVFKITKIPQNTHFLRGDKLRLWTESAFSIFLNKFILNLDSAPTLYYLVVAVGKGFIISLTNGSVITVSYYLLHGYTWCELHRSTQLSAGSFLCALRGT